ncbi:MAG: succinate dehydrogenase [Gemmataceae bacterium]
MAQVMTPAPATGFGATARRDNWWLGPLATFLGLMAFIIYGNIVLFQGKYFEIRQDRANFSGPEVAPYLAPFYAPLIYDAHSSHAWIQAARPSWWPGWMPFSSAMLILIFPLGFRFTCYYYRKAYYRSFWLDPPACAVGEPRKGYWGENHWPLLIQNSHRYFMYFAVIFLVLLGWDALKAFWWPVIKGDEVVGHRLGMGLGTLIMIVNVVLLSFYTLGCHSVRHLVGGRLNHFACYTCPIGNGAATNNEPVQIRSGYKFWKWSTRLNEHHMLWAWCSLFSVGFTDFYIRMCAMGYWNDPRFF